MHASFITSGECNGQCTVASVYMCVCLCLCVCVHLSLCTVRALTFESLDLETLFLMCMFIFRISTGRSSSHIKVIGPRSRSQEQKSDMSANKCTRSWVIHLWLKGMQSVFYIWMCKILHIAIT